jgi:hypothetical protein
MSHDREPEFLTLEIADAIHEDDLMMKIAAHEAGRSDMAEYLGSELGA